MPVLSHPLRRAYAALPALLLLAAPAGAQDGIRFTAEQLASGERTYRETCQICHGNNLANGQFGTPLRGSYFRNNWKGKSLGELVQHTYEKMPPDNVMSLTLQQYAEVVAFILSRNDIAPGDLPIEADLESLNHVPLPWQ